MPHVLQVWVENLKERIYLEPVLNCSLSVSLEEDPASSMLVGNPPSSASSLPHPLFSVLQQDTSSRGSTGGRERLLVEPPLPQEKAGGPAIPSHLLSTPYPFGISPSSVVQDSRFPPLK